MNVYMHKYSCFHMHIHILWGAIENTQQLRVYIALEEDLDSVLSTHMMAHTRL